MFVTSSCFTSEEAELSAEDEELSELSEELELEELLELLKDELSELEELSELLLHPQSKVEDSANIPDSNKISDFFITYTFLSL